MWGLAVKFKIKTSNTFVKRGYLISKINFYKENTMNVTLDGGSSNLTVFENHLTKKWLKELPPDWMPFEKFRSEFNLEATSTEHLHPNTLNLSQKMHFDSISAGLEQLVSVDETVIGGMNVFEEMISTNATAFSDKLKSGGRIFLVGCGSSGRVAIDLAAKCNAAFPEFTDKVIGVIAGGDSAMLRAKEGFEDSEDQGKRALEKFNVGINDSVILISASGSASFNVGSGDLAADCGADVYYFYNSESIPQRTQDLFERARNKVQALCVDIGPQAISGSTRLQAATFAEAGLGALVVSALLLANGKKEEAGAYTHELIDNMIKIIALIRENLDKIANFVVCEHHVFSDPRSNFRKLSDETKQGLVTFVSSDDCLRELLTDTTETSPTFSTNPPEKVNEVEKKRAEFRAYLLGGESNEDAWKTLLGREINPADVADTNEFLLSSDASGVGSYKERTQYSGNMLIGVAKMGSEEDFPVELITELELTQLAGLRTGLILLCRGVLTNEQRKIVNTAGNVVLVIENVPTDKVGLSETLLLKQILNLISNGSMVMMNKVHGNRMIDVRASNKKLIDRCIRLIKSIWSDFHPDSKLDNEQLYNFIAHVDAKKKNAFSYCSYTPSVVKIVLAMLALNMTPDDFSKVVKKLYDHYENIDWIGDCRI